MMKKYTSVLLYILFIGYSIFFISCSSKAPDSEQEVKDHSLVLESIKGVQVMISGNVYIQKGSTQGIRIESTDYAFQRMSSRVINGIWTIEYTSTTNTHYPANIYVTLTDLERIDLQSSAQVYMNSQFEKDGNITLLSSGSGDMNVALKYTNIQAQLTGSGSITAAGNASQLNVSVSGSGSYKGFGVLSKNVHFTSTGSGNTEIYAELFLDGTMSGSGNVSYKGYPQINVERTGSGQFLNAN